MFFFFFRRHALVGIQNVKTSSKQKAEVFNFGQKSRHNAIETACYYTVTTRIKPNYSW
jgi:hypothetical protein